MYSPPRTILWLFLALTGSSTLYYAAVVSGLYKDSLMDQFRKYGEERHVYPICRFLFIAGIFSLVLSGLIGDLLGPVSYIRRLFPASIFLGLAFSSWFAALLIFRNASLREALPRWYFGLLRNTSRQERRQLGYAWLRMPARMRMRMNGDQKAFEVWTELVRLTVIYGAHDPDSPWVIWT